LGNDPDIKSFDGGDKIANLSVATTEKWLDSKGELQERTEWHRVVLRGRTAGVAEKYLKKGSLVFLEGANRTRKYTGSDGVERYTTEVSCNVMKMLDGKSAPATEHAGAKWGQSRTEHVGVPWMMPTTCRMCPSKIQLSLKGRVLNSFKPTLSARSLLWECAIRTKFDLRSRNNIAPNS